MSEISNEELRVFMGTRVMGWRGVGMGWFDKSGHLISKSGWDPPTDLNQAFECVEKVCNNIKFRIAFSLLKYNVHKKGHQFNLYFNTDESTFGDCCYGDFDKSPARAVCLAIKAFKEGLK